MKKYYIIDSLGVRHGIVNANSDIEAINIYKADKPQWPFYHLPHIEYIIIAVRPEELSLLIQNLKNYVG